MFLEDNYTDMAWTMETPSITLTEHIFIYVLI